MLLGLGGADSLFGFGGRDLLEGGADADTLDGGKDGDVLVDGIAIINDSTITRVSILATPDPLTTLRGFFATGAVGFTLDREGDLLIGGAGDDTIFSFDGPDTIRGGGGFDGTSLVRPDSVGDFVMDFGTGTTVLSDGTVLDNVEFVQILTGAGNDTLTGGRAADVLRSLGGDDLLCGRGGDDLIVAGESDDTIQGGDGADTIFGEAGFDRIDGGDGQDFLSGGPDGAELTGGRGRDTFRFGPPYGFVEITDFNQDGNDTLLLAGFGPDFDTAEEVLAVARQDGANTIIEFPDPSGGTSIKLELREILVSGLTEADFVFQ